MPGAGLYSLQLPWLPGLAVLVAGPAAGDGAAAELPPTELRLAATLSPSSWPGLPSAMRHCSPRVSAVACLRHHASRICKCWIHSN